jgi:serine/threonine-protein kinase
VRQLGPYLILGDLAVGGMATVRLGRHRGPHGFVGLVAIKELHEQHAVDPELRSMLLDEARVSARIRHANVVATTDIVAGERGIAIVMDYVEGASLADVLRALAATKATMPPDIVSGVLVQALRGLQAAHDVKSEGGAPLGLVHRDVSPHNIMLGVDGVVRLIDFGVAKAAGRLQVTRAGSVKGKLQYMAPEQLRNRPLSCKTDLFAAGVVLWEMLVGERLFQGDEGTVVERILLGKVPAPSTRAPGCAAFDAVVARATARSPNARYASAAEMAKAVENAATPASPSAVGAWLDEVASEVVRERASRVASIVGLAARSDEAATEVSDPPAVPAAPRRTQRGWIYAALALLGIGGLAGARAHASARAGAPAVSSAQLAPSSVVEERGASLAPAQAEPPPILASSAPLIRSAPPTPEGRATAPRAMIRPPRRPDCSIPYVVDQTGMKTYRRECLDTP